MARLAWFIQGSPKCSHNCCYKREAERNLMTEEGNVIKQEAGRKGNVLTSQEARN